jgi:NADH:ubiquinone oxidoreductase subunit 4 (subunit M)
MALFAAILVAFALKSEAIRPLRAWLPASAQNT